MLQNFIKLTLRQLWRNRLFTGLNVLGLSIGLGACWIIFQLVSYEFSFDAQHPKGERIYKIVSLFNFDGKESGNAGAPKPLAEGIRKQISGVESVVGVHRKWITSLQIPQSTGKPLVFPDVENVMATTNAYFKMVPYQWLAGSANSPLSHPNQVVLTNSRAQKYFPNLKPEQIIGKTMLYWDTLSVEVTGIVANLDRPSSFSGEEFLSLPTIQTGQRAKDFVEAWGSTNSDDQIYMLVDEKTNVTQLAKNINDLSNKKAEADFKKWGNFKRRHELIPLTEVHFRTQYRDNNRTVDKNTLYALMGLALFLLALAIINYINLTTAQVPQRAREIGIRKTLGSPRGRLVGQFLGETFLVTLFACGLAYVWTLAFRSGLGDLLPSDLKLYQNVGQTIGFMLLLILVVCVLSGWYPSLLVTRFQPTQVLRGQIAFSVGKNKFTLRKSLIVFQFVIAQAFIIGAIILNQQIRYALEKDLGFNREAVLTFQAPWKLLSKPEYKDKHLTLKEELKRIPEIGAVSLGNPPFNQSFSSNTHKYKDKKGEIERLVYRKNIDTDLIELYGMKLLAGRNLQPSDTVREYLVNETAVREFGFKNPQEAIGKYIAENGSNRAIPIVGVVSDFHTATFTEKIQPLALMTSKDDTGQFNIKMASKSPADWQKGIKKMEALWKKTFPEAPFEYKFYDDMLKQYYESERNMAKIVNLATAVAILISCLGLFGLATLTAYQRTKEIGVRKVLGASIAGIVGLISKDFLILVLAALVIAGPIAWWLMNEWLSDFVYRINISWWVFALTALLSVLIAFLTVSYQSIKAALMNPTESLKTE
ncbi:ABC transporter permease [Runella sp.]|uniref:ABC transporter permease n=1 Tax=Runella sp. TaxID=1960881 RepID=UPI003D0BA965